MTPGDLPTVMGSNSDGHPDVWTRKAVRELKASCDTCGWKGKLVETDDHSCVMRQKMRHWKDESPAEFFKAVFQLISKSSDAADRIASNPEIAVILHQHMKKKIAAHEHSLAELNMTVERFTDKFKNAMDTAKEAEYARVAEASVAAAALRRERKRKADDAMETTASAVYVMNNGHRKKCGDIQKKFVANTSYTDKVQRLADQVSANMPATERLLDISRRMHNVQTRSTNGLFVWRIRQVQAKITVGNKIWSSMFHKDECSFHAYLDVGQHNVGITIQLVHSLSHYIPMWPVDLSFSVGLYRPTHDKRGHMLPLEHVSMYDCKNPVMVPGIEQSCDIKALMTRAEIPLALFPGEIMYIEINTRILSKRYSPGARPQWTEVIE